MLRPLVLAAVAAAALAAPAAALPPSNDDFADASVLVGEPGTVTGSTVDATKEPDEPDHAGNPGGHSAWFRWKAPRDGLAGFETESRDFGGDFLSLEFLGWKHNSFSSAPLLCGVPRNWPKTARPAAASPENITLLTATLLEFFGHYLRGRGTAEALFTGKEFPSERVGIHRRPGTSLSR